MMNQDPGHSFGRLPMDDYIQSMKNLLGFTQEEIDMLRRTEDGRLYIMCIGFAAGQLDNVGTVLNEIARRLKDQEARLDALESKRIITH